MTDTRHLRDSMSGDDALDSSEDGRGGRVMSVYEAAVDLNG